MSNIIRGLKPSSFKTKDEQQIRGVRVFTGSPITSKGGSGEEPESFFLTDEKLSALDFVPEVGMDIEILYNRFGKVKTIIRVNSDNDFIEIE